MVNFLPFLLAAMTVITPAQPAAPTVSGTEPLIEAGWMVVVDGETYVDGNVVGEVAATLDTYSGETPGYNREEKFGSAWVTKIDGCDTRNRILQRDLVSFQTRDDGCTVVTGIFDDPYTGKTIDFQRSNYPNKGDGNSKTIEIDHIVPLKAGWNGGADTWTQEERIAFANDPMNLWASDGPTNSSKSDSLFGAWQPPNTDFLCEYVAKQVWVLDFYDIAVLQSDKDALVSQSATCAELLGSVETTTDPIEPTQTEPPATPEPAEVDGGFQISPTVVIFSVVAGVAIIAVIVWISTSRRR